MRVGTVGYVRPVAAARAAAWCPRLYAVPCLVCVSALYTIRCAVPGVCMPCMFPPCVVMRDYRLGSYLIKPARRGGVYDSNATPRGRGLLMSHSLYERVV